MAAIVAGLFAADHLYELALSKEEMLARATEIEGHPDNVAAAIYGGFVVCGAGDGAPTAARFDPPEGLEGIVVIPPEEVSTERAREAIPAQVPLAEIDNYTNELKAATGGQGRYTIEFSHYEPVPPQVQKHLTDSWKPRAEEE